MDKRMYSNSSNSMSTARQRYFFLSHCVYWHGFLLLNVVFVVSMQQQRGGMNNYMPMNSRAAGSMGGYGGQGVKRMRSDDPRSDNMNATHRMKWDEGEGEGNPSFMERNDVDQRSEYETVNAQDAS